MPTNLNTIQTEHADDFSKCYTPTYPRYIVFLVERAALV